MRIGVRARVRVRVRVRVKSKISCPPVLHSLSTLALTLKTARNGATISIGDGSNVQDNVAISAVGPHANVVIGDQVILAHNATVDGPSTIGAPGGAPAFVGFNAIIDGATVQPGAMVSSLAKVAPGIVIPTGYKVLPGMYIQTQAQADDPSLGKVAKVTAARHQVHERRDSRQ